MMNPYAKFRSLARAACLLFLEAIHFGSVSGKGCLRKMGKMRFAGTAPWKYPSRQRIERLAKDEGDRRMAIWLKVRLGGDRLSGLARVYGYRDGTGICRVVQRLVARAGSNKMLAKHLSQLRPMAKAS